MDRDKKLNDGMIKYFKIYILCRFEFKAIPVLTGKHSSYRYGNMKEMADNMTGH